MPGLNIKPSVIRDEAKNEWIAHFEEKPFVIKNVRRPSEEAAWAVINGTEAPKASGKEILQRIADQMAKSAKAAVE